MRRPDLRAAPKHRFDLSLEALRTKCALLLQVGTDVRDSLRSQYLVEQCLICLLSRGRLGPKTQVFTVRSDHRIVRAMGIGVIG